MAYIEPHLTTSDVLNHVNVLSKVSSSQGCSATVDHVDHVDSVFTALQESENIL